MSQQITWNFGVIRENPSELFQISANLHFGAKFGKEVREKISSKIQFCDKILIIKSTTYNVSKTLSCIKIHLRRPEISPIVCQKTCEIDWNSQCFFIRVNFIGFHTFFDIQSKISPVSVDGFWCKIAFWKRNELYFLWPKFRNLEEFRWIFSNNSEVSSYLLGHAYITFLKGCDASYPMTIKKLLN